MIFKHKALARFIDFIERDGTDCWLWTGATYPKGYAEFHFEGGMVQGHRWSYETFIGPIPEGSQIDHRCRVKRCVNPEHLRLATNKQNAENVDVRADNKSGYRGVSFHKATGKWAANVWHHGVLHYLGLHDDPETANELVVAKRLELFTYNESDKK